MDSPKVGAGGAALRVLCWGLLAGALFAHTHRPAASPLQVPTTVSDRAPQVAALLEGRLPVVAEHRYRIAGKVRPLLLFWVSKDNIGAARVRWRRGENGAAGFDLLIGSDPVRAPRKINRWGFLMEEFDGEAAQVFGVIKKSEEETLEQAKSNVANEKAGNGTFRMIRASVNASGSNAQVTEAAVARDYSYRDLEALVGHLLVAGTPQPARVVPLPSGGRQGLLLSLYELLHDGVEGVRASGKAPPRKSVAYVFYRKQYELTRASAEIEKGETYGGVAYPRLLKSAFELRARGEPWVENFSVVCGLDGAVAEVPVFMTYQPRWWLKLELVLDENQAF